MTDLYQGNPTLTFDEPVVELLFWLTPGSYQLTVQDLAAQALLLDWLDPNQQFIQSLQTDGAGWAQGALQATVAGVYRLQLASQSVNPGAYRYTLSPTSVASGPLPGVVSLDEDQARTLTWADFGLDGATASHVQAVQVLALTGQGGSLRLDGQVVNGPLQLSANDVAAGRLSLQPDPNEHGTAYATLSYQLTVDAEVMRPAQLTLDVSAVDDAPVGLPRVLGTLVSGQTLTADASLVSDADGLGTLSWQWLANGNPLAGANQSSLTLNSSHVGQTLAVQLSYTDGDGHSETLTSDSTATVARLDDHGDTPGGGRAPLQTSQATTGTLEVADDADAFQLSLTAGDRYRVDLIGTTLGDPLLQRVDAAGQVLDSHDDLAEAYSEQVWVPATDTQVWDPHASQSTIFHDAVTRTDTTPGYNAQRTVWESQLVLVDSGVGYVDEWGDWIESPPRYEWQLVSRQEWYWVPGTSTVVVLSPAWTETVWVGGYRTQTVAAHYDTVQHAADRNARLEFTASADGPVWLVARGDGTQTGSYRLEVTRLNAAPTATSAHATVQEDGRHVFSAADFGFSDADAGDQLQSVTLTRVDPGAGAASGQLWLDSGDGPVAVTAGQVVTAADLSAGRFSYTPGAQAHGSGQLAFGFRVNDGEVASNAAYTLTLDVDAVNDAPTGTVGVTGVAAVSATLTARTPTLADADGLGTLQYQWLADGNPVNGATAAQFTPGAALAGQALSVRVTYTDGSGTLETVTSTATAPVRGMPDVRQADGAQPEAGVRLVGSAAASALHGLQGRDTLRGGAGNDMLFGGEGADLLSGEFDDDRLDGGAGDDTLDGGSGADTLLGGAGNDTYVVERAGDQLIETTEPDGGDDAGGIDVVRSVISFSLDRDAQTRLVEHLRLEGGADIDATGNDRANTLYANAGANTLDGRGGVDWVSYLFAGTGVTVSLDTADPQATGGSGSDTLLNVENLAGSQGDDQLTGSSGANSLKGHGGHDLLDGGAGADTLSGGAGNDTLDGGEGQDVAVLGDDDSLIDLATGTVQGSTEGDDRLQNVEQVQAAGGHDTVQGSDLADWVDGGQGNDQLAGRGGADLLRGGAGDDRLDGGAGNDTLEGGAGHDTLALGDDASLIHLGQRTATGSTEGHDVFSGIESVEAGGGNDTLVGSAAADRCDGGAGQDQLNGGGGNDLLSGGTGHDTLNGGGGQDTLLGGAGNDTYIVDHAGDRVCETTVLDGTLDAGGSADLVRSTVSYRLDTDAGLRFVEHLRLEGAGALDGTGNDRANTIYASAGNNVLDGLGGTDWVSYLFASAAVDVALGVEGPQATGGSGADTLLNFENLAGSAGNDHLRGDAAANALQGHGGDDRLAGGAGLDTLTGGAGNDVFRFDTALDNAGNVDRLTDFVAGSDTMELDSQVFAGLGDPGVLAADRLVLLDDAGTPGAGACLLYERSTGRLYFDADGEGEAAAVLFAHLTAGLALTAGDFSLV